MHNMHCISQMIIEFLYHIPNHTILNIFSAYPSDTVESLQSHYIETGSVSIRILLALSACSVRKKFSQGYKSEKMVKHYEFIVRWDFEEIVQ